MFLTSIFFRSHEISFYFAAYQYIYFGFAYFQMTIYFRSFFINFELGKILLIHFRNYFTNNIVLVKMFRVLLGYGMHNYNYLYVLQCEQRIGDKGQEVSIRRSNCTNGVVRSRGMGYEKC